MSEVGRLPAAAFDEPLVCPVLLGRDAQLDGLRQVAAQSASGQGQTVLVAGEAGIGKSRLVHELAAQLAADGWVVLQGNCFERDAAQPYAPVAELLRRALGSPPPPATLERLGARAIARARVLPELARWLPAEAEPAPTDPEQDRRRLQQVIGEVLSETDSSHPALLIVEDVHWADGASLDLLDSFARSLDGRRILLLLTYRSDEVNAALRQLWASLDRARLIRELHLPPLDVANVDAMLRAILSLDRAPRRDLLELVSELTQGNPFFVEELVRALVADGQLIRSGGSWSRANPSAELRLPRTVRAAVQRRTEQLSRPAQAILQLAAIVGQRFDFDFLRSLQGADELDFLERIKELVAAGLLDEVSAEQLAFHHALTRQAILGQLLARERRMLHRRVADAIEHVYADDRAAHLAELAQHYFAAGLWSHALETGRQAGEHALQLYALGAAAEHFTRAIEAAEHLGSSPGPELLQVRGQAREALGDFDGAQADYTQALALAADPAAQWQALIGLGGLWASRDYTQVGPWLERALAVARSTEDSRLVARSLNRLGNWMVNTGRTGEGLELHRQALPLVEAAGDAAGVAETLDLLGMALGLHGDTAAAADHFGRAVVAFRTLGDVRGWASSLASEDAFSTPLTADTSAAALRSLEDSRRALREALRVARLIGAPAAEAYAHVVAAQSLNSYGELGEALEHGQAARRIAADIGHQQWEAGALCVLGESYVFALAPDAAIEVLEPGFPLARHLRSDWWTGLTATYLGLAYLLRGDHPRAHATLAAAWPREQVPVHASQRRVAWVWGELALAERRPEQALAIGQGLLDSAPGGTHGQGIPWLHKLVGEAHLLMGQLDAALGTLELARQGAVARQQRPALWQIDRALVRLHLLRRAPDAAYWHVEQAKATINSLAASLAEAQHGANLMAKGQLGAHLRERALASLPGAPAAAARRAEAQQAGGLSQREREVAQQVALGRSNREIAEALVLGERTIETHVSNVLAKLGLASRRQIAAWVAEQGWPPPPR